jgi:hypothetical protein
VGSYVELLRSVREKRPDAVILNLIYSLDTPSYDVAEARDGTLTRYTETAVSQFVAEQGLGESSSCAVLLVEAPPSGEDGGSLEHQGRDGHFMYAELFAQRLRPDCRSLDGSGRCESLRRWSGSSTRQSHDIDIDVGVETSPTPLLAMGCRRRC